MIYIFLVAVYVLLMAIMHNLAVKSNRYFPFTDSEVIDKYLWYFICFFVIVAGTRFDVGTDSWGYHMKFKDESDIQLYYDTGEILYWAWVKLCRMLGHNYILGLGGLAFVQIYCITKGLCKYKYLLVFLPIVLFGGKYFLSMMAAVRQMTAACILFYASTYAFNKDYKRFFLCVLIAMGFHHSALFFAPVIFLPKTFNLAKMWKFTIPLFLLCVIIGQSPSFQEYAKNASELTTMLGYEQHSDYILENMQDINKKEQMSMGMVVLSWLFSAIALMWYGGKLRETYIAKIPQFDQWFFLFFFYICLFFLIARSDDLFMRPLMHFELYMMAMSCILLHYLYNYADKSRIMYRLIVFIICCCMLRTMFVAAPQYPHESSSYKSIIFHPW